MTQKHTHMQSDKRVQWSFCSIFLLFFILYLSAEETSDYVHYRLGVKYKNEKKLDLAIAEFRKVLAAFPDHYNTYMHLAEIREYQGRHRLAIYNLRKALAHNPGWGKAKKMLAAAYVRDRQFQNAIKELQDYLQYCDPEERKEVQKQIDQIIDIIKDGDINKYFAEQETELPTTDTLGVKKEEEEEKEGVSKKGEPVVSKEEKPKIGKETTKPIVSSKSQKKISSSKNQVEEQFKAGIEAYSEGVNSQDQKQFDKAIQHFRNTLKLQPNHAGAYYYAGLIRRRNGQNSMAKINFSKAISFPELGFNAHFYLGKIYGEEKKYKNAIKQLKLYINKSNYEPGKREAENLIKRYEVSLADLHKDTVKVDIVALGQDEIYREISKISPKTQYTPVEIRIGSLLFMAIVDTLTDPGQNMLAGIRLFRENKFDKAIEQFKELLLRYPNGDVAARCHYDIGVCYMKLKNYPYAENKFQLILDRFPSHKLSSNSLFLKALAYSEQHELKRAENLFRKFIQKNRNHNWTGKAYEKLGDTYVELMQEKKAVDAFQSAAKLAKSPLDGVFAYYKLGETYSKIGNTTRAIESFNKAIVRGEKEHIDIKVPDAYYRIADLLYQQKKYSKAFENYRKVTRKYTDFPDTPWGIFQIGSIYKNTKKYDKAIATFNQLIQSYPDDYWAKQAQWKLEDTVWEHEYRAVLNQ